MLHLQHQNPPSLLTMLKCAGRFYLYTQLMATTIPFSKGYSNPHDIISLLQSRGLHISDTNKAEHYIERIGYYRLSAYMYPFLCTPKELHKYKNNASFDKVMMLYRFDKKLRMLLFNEIEKIEVAVRSAIANTCCEITGNPFWMTDANYFTDKTKFAKTMQLIDAELRKSREDFIAHFKSTQIHIHQHGCFLKYYLLVLLQTSTITSKRKILRSVYLKHSVCK